MGIFATFIARTDKAKTEAEAALEKLTDEERGAIEAAVSNGFDKVLTERKQAIRAEFMAGEFETMYKQRLETEHPELSNDPIRKELWTLKEKQAASEKRERDAALMLVAHKELGEFALSGVIDPRHIIGADEETTRANATAAREKMTAFLADVSKKAATNEAAKFNTPTPPTAGGTATNNPWAKNSLNLTKQAEIMETNPTLAATLKAAATGQE